jgi:hypothetical protein
VAVEPFRVAHRHVGPAPRITVEPLAPAVDATGQIFVPWSQQRGAYPLTEERALMSTSVTTWRTTRLWGWTRHANFAAAALSRNGRAVAVRTVTNAQYTRTAVAMRVFRPG